MLCIILVDSHLILALDSKSVQCVCDIPLLYQVFLYQYLQVFVTALSIYILCTSLSFAYCC